MGLRNRVWALLLVGPAVVLFVLVGVGVYRIKRNVEPAGCTDGLPYGLSAWDYTGTEPPDEDLEQVVGDVDVIARVTVLEDVGPVADEFCNNRAFPSSTVRVRIDEIMYSDLPSDETPQVGSQIQVTTVDTMAPLTTTMAASADPDKIVALNANSRNPIEKVAVPWLARGRSRVEQTRWYKDEWDEAIAAATH